MKKALILLFILILSSIVFAQERLMSPTIIVPPEPDGNNIVGGNQYYTVNYDGEGEAAVLVKLEIQNIDKKNLTELSLEIPGSNVRIISIVQEYYEKMQQCIDYEEVCTNFSEGKCQEYIRRCKRYYDQIVYPPKYYPIAYEKEALSESNLLRFNLPKEIGTQENAVVLIYYKSNKYAEKKFLAYKIDFETIKINADTQNVRVAINVDQDLVLEGKKAEVNYRDNFAMAEKSLSAPIAGASSDSLQQLSNFVTYAEGYVKTASGLDPLESFSVKGRYAKSWVALHWFGTLVTLLALVVIGLGLYSLYVKKIAKLTHGRIIAKTIGLGIASSVSVLLLWFLTSFLVNLIRQSLDWQTANLFAVLLYLMTGLMMLLVFFGPPVYMGVKHGFMSGVWAVVATVAFMFLLLVVVLVFFLLFGTGQQYPIPIYKTFGGVAEAAIR